MSPKLLLRVLLLLLIGISISVQYSCEKNQEKAGLPKVVTHDVKNTAVNAALCRSEVIDDGNLPVTVRGVIWGTSGQLDEEDSVTVDDNGLGVYYSKLLNLQEDSSYFVKAYATNDSGTSYGEVRSFVAKTPECGDLVVYYDEQTYHTVKVGQQCWMRENLNIGKMINNLDTPKYDTIIEKYCWANMNDRCVTYGGLYQWDEMMRYTLQEGARGICPEGWHIPSEAEWDTLIEYLGGQGYAGGRMKYSGEYWRLPNNGADNASGFSALPGGWISDCGFFSNLGQSGNFWSSSNTTGMPMFIYLTYESRSVLIDHAATGIGFSVRCIKD